MKSLRWYLPLLSLLPLLPHSFCSLLSVHPKHTRHTQTQMTAHKAYPEQVAQVAPGKRQAALLEKLPIEMCELVAAVVPRTDLLPLALTCHALHPLCVARAKTERVNWVVHKSIGMATLKQWLLRDRMSRLHESMPPPPFRKMGTASREIGCPGSIKACHPPPFRKWVQHRGRSDVPAS